MAVKGQLKDVIKWLGVILVISCGTGVLSAFFLTALTAVTEIRRSHQWLILGLPLIGMAFTWLYQRYGGLAQQGNNLVINRGNGGSQKIPLVMLPLTLFGTITSHLFGASVGREGTAVQMGGSLSEHVAKLFKLTESDISLAVICGISGSFSSVFGTPFAGALFAVEVLMIGKIKWQALGPSLLTAILANLVTGWLGVTHSDYPPIVIPGFSLSLIGKVVVAGVVFGSISSLFSWSIPIIKGCYQKLIKAPVYRSGFGGLVVLLLVVVFGTTHYLGLSLPLLTDAFNGQQGTFDFINKLIFTVFSLGAGFQGGEVTPLFEIGATLGATLADWLEISVSFLAALGFIGVFAGATNTPLACAVMGMELFGPTLGIWLVVISFISYFFSRNKGIYSQQMTAENKYNIGRVYRTVANKKRL